MKNINIKKFLVPASFTKEVYEVLYNANDKKFVSCSCKSFQYNQEPVKSCKHTKSLTVQLNNFKSFYEICSGK